MLRNFVSYFICILCFSLFIFMPIQVSETSPSETPNTLDASAWCYANDYGPYTECGAQASAWSIPWSGISNEYTYGDYDVRYGSVSVKWYPDPPDYRNKGVFNYGCSEWASHTETYWFIGSGDFSARSKAFVGNQDGHDSDNGRVN